VPNTQVEFHLSLSCGKLLMFSLFAMSMVVGALDSFTVGETLFARHPLGHTLKHLAAELKEKPLWGFAIRAGPHVTLAAANPPGSHAADCSRAAAHMRPHAHWPQMDPRDPVRLANPERTHRCLLCLGPQRI
jgi:hypothetical protein